MGHRKKLKLEWMIDGRAAPFLRICWLIRFLQILPVSSCSNGSMMLGGRLIYDVDVDGNSYWMGM